MKRLFPVKKFSKKLVWNCRHSIKTTCQLLNNIIFIIIGFRTNNISKNQRSIFVGYNYLKEDNR